jgi:3-methyladenine DNA glycosylase AlkC
MATLLKDLYTNEYINFLATNIRKFYIDFNVELFTQSIFCIQWKDMKLKQRMRHISTNIGLYINENYNTQIEYLILVYNHIQVKTGNRKNKLGLENMIFADFVEVYGLLDFDISIKAMQCFTINSTSEFAIRQFILKYEDATMKQMLIWATSPNEQLRRLASEGCRPRLPWACSLPIYKKHPAKILKILDVLQDDDVLYVKKSVANNLNDISKDNPQLLIDISKKWYGQNDNKNWIIKHACRTLLKQGNQEVLNIFGFEKKDNLNINNFEVDDEVRMGNKLNFSFELEDKNILGKLRIEYSIDFVRLNNKTKNKVFYIAQKVFNTNTHKINKKHSFKYINTRKYYSGTHTLNIIINGTIFAQKEFEVKII